MKKAIIVVSFGTSHLEALKNSIDKIENKIKELKSDRYKIGVFREESEYTYLYFIISLSTDLIHISLNLQCLVAIFYHGGTMGDEDDGLIMR